MAVRSAGSASGYGVPRGVDRLERAPVVTAVSAPPRRNGAPVKPVIRRRRSSRLVLVAVVLAILGGLAGVLAYREATGRVSVVAVARPVAFGQVIELADLRELQLPADTGLATLPWDQVDVIAGRRAATDLPVDTVVPPQAVTDQRPPQRGEAVVGLSLPPGRAPMTSLEVRDQVQVITPAVPAPIRATVLQAGVVDDAGRMAFDLLVADGSAADLAKAATNDQTVLVLVADR
jgi:hypothetical protein